MISIIIPVYNAEAFLSDCLDSVCGQSYSDIEIIVVNDGSADGSAAICSRYADKDKRIKYISKANGGVSSARNVGLQHATGEYIMFVDADDVIQSDCAEKLYDSLISANSELSVCGFKRFGGGENKLYAPASAVVEGKSEVAVFVADQYLTNFISSPCGKLYVNSKITQKFDTSMSLGEDLLFNIGYFENIESLSVIPDTLYLYRMRNDGNLTGTYKAGYYDGMKKIYSSARAYLNKYPSLEDISFDAVAYKFYMFAIAFLVKQHSNNNFDNRSKRAYARMICEDEAFLEAVSIAKARNYKDKLLFAFIRRRFLFGILALTKLRAIMKKAKI